MPVEFKDSETKKNLMRAFAGESQARNRYTFAADVAHQQKEFAIEHVFIFTADQEKAHAEIYYNELKPFVGETITVDGGYPVDLKTTVEELLRSASHNEFEEHDDVYKKFEEKAREEGFPQIAAKFKMIAEVEKIHGDRFLELANQLRDNKLYISEVVTDWMCLHCGYIYQGKEVPQVCPSCKKERGYFVRIDLAPYTKGQL